MAGFTTTLAALAIGGTALDIFGKVKQGQEAKEAAEFNARIAEEEAGLIRQSSILTEFQQRKQLDQTTGKQIAAVARSGIAFTGSPLIVMADSLANAELGIQIDKFNAESAARRKESGAKQLRRFGRQDERSAFISAGATLLKTGATLSGNFSKRIPKKKIGE